MTPEDIQMIDFEITKSLAKQGKVQLLRKKDELKKEQEWKEEHQLRNYEFIEFEEIDTSDAPEGILKTTEDM